MRITLRATLLILTVALPPAHAQTNLGTWLSPDDGPAPAALHPIAADGTVIASRVVYEAFGYGDHVGVYDATTGLLTRVLPDPDVDPAGFPISPALIDVDVDQGRVAVGIPSDPGVGAGNYEGRVRIYDAATGAELLNLTAADGLPGDRFGTSVSLAGNLLLVGAPYADDLGNESGSAYLYDATTGALLHKWFSGQPEAEAHFGDGVALGGNFAVVGEPDFGAGNRGTTYVFDATTGAQIDKLIPSDAVAGIRFGADLAIHADRLLAGAPGQGFAATVGAYVFDLPTGNELFKLTPSGDTTGTFFGDAVAIDATRILIGAWDEEATGLANNDGRTYLFDAADGSELARIELDPDDYYFTRDFGRGVALTQGSALSTAEAPTPPSSIRATAFTLDPSTGAMTGTLEVRNGPYLDSFGARVAIDGDLALVAAIWDDADGEDTGTVYVYDVPSGQLLRTLVNPAADPEGFCFGCGVGIEGDRAVVGAYYGFVPSFVPPGFAAVYDVPTGDLLHVVTKPNANTQEREEFGWAVAVHAGRMLVGAPAAWDVGPGRGAAYLFDLESGALLHTFLPPAGQSIRDFGEHVALGGPWAVVGGAYVSIFPSGSWPVHVYDVTTGALVSTLLPSDLTNIDPQAFGQVATDGTRVLVGGVSDAAPNNGPPGAAWLFDAATGAELWRIESPMPSQGSVSFGKNVALEGNRAIVASIGGTYGTFNGAYVYDVATAQWLYTVNQPTSKPGDTAIAIDGSNLLVGRPRTDTPSTDAGSVTLYDVPEMPSALPYCAPKTSTAGCTATIGWSGPAAVPTSGQGDWAITASGVQGKRSGLLIGGLSGPAAIPFSGGTLCVFPPQKRGLIQPSGGTQNACDGAYQLVVNDVGFPQGFDAGAGQTAWYQWWYRDPPSPTGPIALSNALEVPFF